MPWLWSSFDEYSSHINPIYRDNAGVFRYKHLFSWGDMEASRLDYLRDVESALNSLETAGVDENQTSFSKPKLLKIHAYIEQIVNSVEQMLVFDRRLGMTPETSNFANAKDEVLLNWERYLEGDYLGHCLVSLYTSTRALIACLHSRTESDRSFLLSEFIVNEPPPADFVMARDLFSLGFDEAGLFYSGRGLESTLREALRRRKFDYESKPIWEKDFYHFIECLDKLRWKEDSSRVLDKQTINLLHMLRTMRNAGAHPGVNVPIEREVAVLAAKAARHIFDLLASSERELELLG